MLQLWPIFRGELLRTFEDDHVLSFAVQQQGLLVIQMKCPKVAMSQKCNVSHISNLMFSRIHILKS